MINRIIKIWPVIVLSAAISFSPSIVLGRITNKAIEIRIEDILIFLLAIIWFISLLIGKKKIKKNFLFISIFLWLGIGLSSVLLNFIFGTLDIARGFFYFLKQAEFFVIYFYVFNRLKDIESIKTAVKAWFLFSFGNVLYIIYQVVSKRWNGEYGAGAIGEKGVFPSGAFFVLLFIFCLNLFLFYFLNLKISPIKKVFLGIMAVSPAIGVYGSASKSNFLALILALFLIIIVFIIKNKNVLKSAIIILVIFSSLTALLFFSEDNIRSAERLRKITNLEEIMGQYKRGRIDFIYPIPQEGLNSSWRLIFGFGFGLVTESHNQYVRNLIETGFLGSFAFLIMIFLVLRKSLFFFFKSNNSLEIALSGQLFISTIVMLFLGMGAEPFLVVRPAETYWFLAAVTVAALSFKTNSYKNSPNSIIDDGLNPKKENIAAVVVTHNPDGDFLSNIDSIKNQVAKVIVVSNGARISLQGAEIIENKINLGQGKALNQGVNLAISLGFKWVLILDQDSLLNSSMVDNLIQAYETCPFREKVKMIGSNCVYKGIGEQKYEKENDNECFFERDVIMASGTLLSANAYKVTGGFREEFFIDSTDVDYCLRIRKNGFRIIVAYDAIMTHEVGNSREFKNILGKKVLITNHSAKRCYYMTRNGLILVREYFFREPSWVLRRIAWYFVIKPALIILYEENKLQKIKYMIKGMADALINKTGKI